LKDPSANALRLHRQFGQVVRDRGEDPSTECVLIVLDGGEVGPIGDIKAFRNQTQAKALF
jgi:hypothetical protein